MAFGKLSGDMDDQPLSEINMIPMIDVMLVLLIVFMITAPLLTNAVKIDLPEATSAANQPQKEDISISIKATGEIYWNNTQVNESDLISHMAAVKPRDGNSPEIQLNVDKLVDYGKVAEVMALASQHGLQKIAFVSFPENNK